MIWYASAAYVAECCARPHCFLKRIIAKDRAEAHDKFVAAMRGANIRQDVIDEAEISVLKHTELTSTPVHGHHRS